MCCDVSLKERDFYRKICHINTQERTAPQSGFSPVVPLPFVRFLDSHYPIIPCSNLSVKTFTIKLSWSGAC